MKKINFKLHRLAVMLCTLECTKAVINVTLTGTTSRHVCKGEDIDFKWSYDDTDPDKDFIKTIQWSKDPSGYLIMQYETATSDLSISFSTNDYRGRVERTTAAGSNDIGMRLTKAGSTSFDDEGKYYVSLIVDKEPGSANDYFVPYRDPQGVEVYVCIGVDDTFPLPSLHLTYDENTHAIACSGPKSLGDTTFAIFDPSMITVVNSTTDTTISKDMTNLPGGTYTCATYCTQQRYGDTPQGTCLPSDATLYIVMPGWSEWARWDSYCEVPGSTRTRSRTCTNPAPAYHPHDAHYAYGPRSCTGADTETEVCPTPPPGPGPTELQPKVDLVWPTFGSQSGGTNITIRGQSLPSHSQLKVYVGPIESITLYQNTTIIITRTLGLEEDETDLLGEKLPIVIKINNIKSLTTDAVFTYKIIPVIESVYPKESIVPGGTSITAKGRNFDSVADIKMETTMVLTKRITKEPPEYEETQTSYATDCQVQNETQMKCITAKITLPDVFVKQITETKRKRDVNIHEFAVSLGLDSGNNRRKRQETPQWVTPQGDYTLEFYIGFHLDGVDDYKNFTYIAIFAEPLFIESGLKKKFRKGEMISFKGKNLDRGITIYDYTITIGSGKCTDIELLSNSLSCLPPQTEPTNTTIGDKEIIIHIGLNVDHFAGHLIYGNDQWPLYVWILIGVLPALVIIVIIVIIVVCVKKRQNRTQ